MSENDAKGGKGGWTDRELVCIVPPYIPKDADKDQLLSLLYLVQKNGITFKYEVVYRPVYSTHLCGVPKANTS